MLLWQSDNKKWTRKFLVAVFIYVVCLCVYMFVCEAVLMYIDVYAYILKCV